MGQSFGSGIQLVEVTTDDPGRGEPKKQVWATAARPELAVVLVLAAARKDGPPLYRTSS
jgi:hypothetical protein